MIGGTMRAYRYVKGGVVLSIATICFLCGYLYAGLGKPRASQIEAAQFQRFVPIQGTPTALDTMTGQQCVTSPSYHEINALKELPICLDLFNWTVVSEKRSAK